MGDNADDGNNCVYESTAGYHRFGNWIGDNENDGNNYAYESTAGYHRFGNWVGNYEDDGYNYNIVKEVPPVMTDLKSESVITETRCRWLGVGDQANGIL